MHVATLPKRLGRYEILEMLSLDGDWRTYRGHDRLLRRMVALWTISKSMLGRQGLATLTRLEEQVRAATRLTHEGIAAVYEYGEDSGLVFVAIEYVEGCHPKEQTRIPAGDAVSVMVQLLDALDYAHEQGVIHSQIRPSSLLLTSKGQLRIVDFGVAGVAGTPSRYLSPEQASGTPADRRSDVFSAGVLFYELLTGVNPLPGSQPLYAERPGRDKERPPSELNPNIPRVFDAVCAKALAKSQFERFATARHFGEGIRQAFESAYNAPPKRAVAYETVIALTFGDSGRTGDVVAAAPVKVPANTPSRPSFSWDDATLRAVEKQLAMFLGPLARIKVREAASKTTDLDRLYSLAAQSLEHPEERQAFLAGKSKLSRSDVQSEAQAMPPRRSASAAPRQERQAAAEIKPLPKIDSRPVAKPPVNFEPVKSMPQVADAIQPGRKPQSKPDLRQAPAAAEAGSDVASRIEELLGKQPENLAGFLKDSSPQVEEVIRAFVASVQALIDMQAAKDKVEALVPQSICFDRLGKASIRTSHGTTTQTIGVVGNPRYAAPESFAEKAGSGESAIASAQIYALGFMFYEILLGRRLFEKTFAGQRTELDWMRWQADLEKKAPPAKSLLEDCPAALSDLLESMTEKHAEKRAGDLASILSSLRAVAQRANKTVVLRRPGPEKAPVKAKDKQLATPVSTPKKRSGLTLILVLLLLVALAAGGFYLWQHPDVYRQLISRFNHAGQPSDTESPGK